MTDEDVIYDVKGLLAQKGRRKRNVLHFNVFIEFDDGSYLMRM